MLSSNKPLIDMLGVAAVTAGLSLAPSVEAEDLPVAASTDVSLEERVEALEHELAIARTKALISASLFEASYRWSDFKLPPSKIVDGPVLDGEDSLTYPLVGSGVSVSGFVDAVTSAVRDYDQRLLTHCSFGVLPDSELGDDRHWSFVAGCDGEIAPSYGHHIYQPELQVQSESEPVKLGTPESAEEGREVKPLGTWDDSEYPSVPYTSVGTWTDGG